MRKCLLVLALFSVVACVTLPRKPSAPQIVTLYRGEAELRSTVGMTRTCPATVRIVSRGDEIYLDSVRLGGRCDDSSMTGGWGQLPKHGANFVLFGLAADPFCGTFAFRVDARFERDQQFLILDYDYDENSCGAVGMRVFLRRV